MIQFDHVSCGYGKETILNDISLSIPAHSITSVIGKNGSGKSTLVKSLIGLSTITAGSIFLDGQPVKGFDSKSLARKVAFLSQQHASPSLSVERLVLHGRFPYTNYPRCYTKTDYLRSEQAMEQADVLKLRHKNVNTLSGGERQKVYLAMCLAKDAEVFLFDEPTTYLDINYQLELVHIIRELKNQGKTIVTVLHDLGLTMELSDTLVVMNQGEIVAVDTPAHIFQAKIIDSVFGIHVKKLMDETGGNHYFFEQ